MSINDWRAVSKQIKIKCVIHVYTNYLINVFEPGFWLTGIEGDAKYVKIMVQIIGNEKPPILACSCINV